MRIYFYFVAFLIIASLALFYFVFNQDSFNQNLVVKGTQPVSNEFKVPASRLVVSEVKIEPVAVYASCGDNQYKAYIYFKESGCRTDSVNKDSGACGLGQAYPCKKLPCSLQDYACQDAWFTNVYMAGRYGTWEAAYQHKIAKGWW